MKTKDICKLAIAYGWTLRRHTGDHAIYTKPGARSVPIPQGAKSLNPGISRAIKKQLGVGNA